MERGTTNLPAVSELTNKTFQDSPILRTRVNHSEPCSSETDTKPFTEIPAFSEEDTMSREDSEGEERDTAGCVPKLDTTPGPEIEITHYPIPNKTLTNSSNLSKNFQNTPMRQQTSPTSVGAIQGCQCSCHHTHHHHHHHTIVINGQPVNKLAGGPVQAAITTREMVDSPKISVLKTASCPAWADGAPKQGRHIYPTLVNTNHLQTILSNGKQTNFTRNNNVDTGNFREPYCDHQIEQPRDYRYQPSMNGKGNCCGTLSKWMIALLVVLFIVIISLLSGLVYFLIQGKVPEPQEPDVPQVSTVLNQTSVCGKYPAKYLSITSRTLTNEVVPSNLHPPKNDNRINVTQAARIIGGTRANVRQYPWQDLTVGYPTSSNYPSKTNPKNTDPEELVDGSMVQGRIYGGQPATAMRFPWQVYLHAASLWVELRGMTCGGSIIMNDWVLTAAHCTDANSDPRLWTVYMGMSNIDKKMEPPAQRSKIIKIIQNPQYVNDFSYDYDVSLMKLETPVTFTPTVQPICLPHSTDEYKDGTKCFVSGWGATTNSGQTNAPKTLQHAQIEIIGDKTCRRDDWLSILVTDRMMCAGTHDGSKDACQGDSGGPLSCYDSARQTWTLAGSVSWGIECGQPKQPGVYTRMTFFVDWIWTEIGKSEGWIEDFGSVSSGDGTSD